MNLSAAVSIVGHKGSSEGVAPGTIEAYEQAIRTGVDMVELDARWTADGVAVIRHDPDLDGVPLAELTVAELRARVPVTEVESVLALAAAHAMPVMLDLKDVGREREAVELVRRHLPLDRFVISTLEDESVAAIRGQAPEVDVGLSLTEDDDRAALLGRARACDARFLSLDVELDLVDEAHRAGFPVFVWTVDDEARLRRLLADPRLRGVVTNRPGLALALRAELGDQLGQ